MEKTRFENTEFEYLGSIFSDEGPEPLQQELSAGSKILEPKAT